MVPLCPWIFQVRESLLWVVSPAILPNRESIPKGPHLFPFTSFFSSCLPFPYRAWHSSAILPVYHLPPTLLQRSNLSLSWSSHLPSTIFQSRNALWTLAFSTVSPSQFHSHLSRLRLPISLSGHSRIIKIWSQGSYVCDSLFLPVAPSFFLFINPDRCCLLCERETAVMQAKWAMWVSL